MTVKLRVTDNDGAGAETTRPLQIAARARIIVDPLPRPITPTQPTTQPKVVKQRKPGKCAKLKGKKRAACIRRSCRRLKGKKKRACVKKVTRRR